MEKKKEHPINRIEEWGCVILTLVILAILSYQVILRFVFHNSNSWSEELARYLFVWFTYIGAGYGVIKKAHIKIDAVINIWPKAIRKYIPTVSNIIFFVYCLVVIYYSTKYTIRLVHTDQVSMGAHVKMWAMYAAIPVGHLLMAIRLLQVTITGFLHPEAEAEEEHLEEF